MGFVFSCSSFSNLFTCRKKQVEREPRENLAS